MKIKLLNYKSEIHYADVGDIKEIESMYIDVIVGNEVLFVVCKDYTIMKFDPSNTRCEDHLDARYPIYNEPIGLNLLKDEDFLNRRNSYDYLWFRKAK